MRNRMKRVFLGWDAPLLPQAASYLCSQIIGGHLPEASQLRLVVPTARARRRLRQCLLGATAEAQIAITDLQVLTIGDLPERLYQPDLPLALELEQTLAWTQTLQAAAGQPLEALVPNQPPDDAVAAWVDLAATVRKLHEALAADGLRFRDVIPQFSGSVESRRWVLLDRLLEDYLDRLRNANRSDPFTSRRQAIENHTCQTDRQLVLIGTADMNRTICQMLDLLKDQVHVLVGAPREQQILFDRFGNVQPEEWKSVILPIQDHQLVSAADVFEQTVAMAESLADFGSQYSADEITIGVADQSFVPFVETELQQVAIASHREQGWPLAQTAPGRLLSLIALLRTRMDWQSFAALVRHADVYQWLDQQLSAESQPGSDRRPNVPWLAQLDGYLANHFPTRLDVAMPLIAQRNYPLVAEAKRRVAHWLSPLSSPPQALAVWCQAIRQVFSMIYPDSSTEDSYPSEPGNDSHPRTSPCSKDSSALTDTSGLGDGVGHTRQQAAIQRVHRMLDRFAKLSDPLDVQVTAATAVEMLLARLSDSPIVLPAKAEEVEILGWLDLALDDAAAMVVVGFNAPFVPEAVTADPFLPGSLRSKLKLNDNERRFARDAYALQLILSTRPQVRFVVGRRGPDGNPTPPSRLLAAADGIDVARRVTKLLDRPVPIAPVHRRWSGSQVRTQLPVPTAGRADVNVMSVTAFSDFLRCPFRFYLRHVLGLRPLDDHSNELAANQFGDLVHASVEDFGRHREHRQAETAEEIYECLMLHLLAYAQNQFGQFPAAAVQLQIDQAKRRLRVVAEHQARRRAEGWQIEQTEASVGPQQGAGIEVDGRVMGLKGRFDRIDFHPQTGQWAILDYKTHGHEPLKKHFNARSQQWTDLQLPLYRLMIPALGIDADQAQVQLGYFNVAQQERQTGIHLADFSEQQFADANRVIADCIRRIWASDFAPSDQPVSYDDYAMICQSGLMSSLLGDDEADDFRGDA